MSILVRETPLGREMLEEGRELGRREGREEGRHEAAPHLSRLLLRQRFGAHPALESTAAALPALPDEERLGVIAAAAAIEDLAARSRESRRPDPECASSGGRWPLRMRG